MTKEHLNALLEEYINENNLPVDYIAIIGHFVKYVNAEITFLEKAIEHMESLFE